MLAKSQLLMQRVKHHLAGHVVTSYIHGQGKAFICMQDYAIWYKRLRKVTSLVQHSKYLGMLQEEAVPLSLPLSHNWHQFYLC